MKVFVYGTLMPGCDNWSMVKDHVKEYKPAKIAAELFHLPYGYPAVREGQGEVYGYVLELADEILPIIDEYEGYYAPGKDNFYEKKNLTITYTETGDTDEALVYIFEGYRAQELNEIGIFIPSGNWQEFITHQNYISA